MATNDTKWPGRAAFHRRRREGTVTRQQAFTGQLSHVPHLNTKGTNERGAVSFVFIRGLFVALRVFISGVRAG